MGFISKLFNTDSDEFKEVRVDREVLESVIYYAKKAYPNEFLAFFDGKIKDKILYITSLIFYLVKPVMLELLSILRCCRLL